MITTCPKCGKAYEEQSREEADSPNRLCSECFKESRDKFKGLKPRNSARPELPETILTPKQRVRLQSRGESVRNLFRKCFLKSAKPKQAIKAFCLDCMVEDKSAIGECGDRCCPLWHFRPYQKKGVA